MEGGRGDGGDIGRGKAAKNESKHSFEDGANFGQRREEKEEEEQTEAIGEEEKRRKTSPSARPWTAQILGSEA